ncbi:AAA family ATPase [Nocardia paucivorans]|uniref:AAA family ATPase n=1 Tax=Nocardia paucivorans TaxID=114259 RepID=UPI0002E8E979|nr:AAA family ATPase [Nocardia paucivorans]
MSPPLDTAPLDPPEHGLGQPDSEIIRPEGRHELRGRDIGDVRELRYPSTAALLFAGIPGAGKSTALHRLFRSPAEAEEPPNGPDDTLVLDSNHVRNTWRHRLHRLPYPLWRPVVHLAHFARIRSALRDHTGPVVIHDCATYGWSRRLLGRWATRHGREFHMILLDVPAAIARAGQFARGRRVGGISFRRHCSRWNRLLTAVDRGQRLCPEPASVIVIDRSGMDRVRRIRFAA